MEKYAIDDTIAAIATGVGESGIGIVRISGKDALAVADRIFVPRDGRTPSTFRTYTTHYGWIVSGSKLQVPPKILADPPILVAGTSPKSNTKGLGPGPWALGHDIVDEVILTVMRAPKSYTKENIVEINCHGGIVALRSVLELVLQNGARLAEPGEFTKRAFLNGRIDLAQAEAVLDVIRAKTGSALKAGAEQVKGVLSAKINQIGEALLDALTVLEADIDFPDEETGSLDLREVSKSLEAIHNELKGLIENSGLGRVLREGVHVVICGKPNVGKSSLLNALLKQERSIVTPIAGTTRDTIEEVIDIKGIPVSIMDTAGILEPRDLIEKKAVQRSRRCINSADLVLLLFDGSRRLDRSDELLIKKLRQKAVIAIINKIDLRQRISRGGLEEIFNNIISLSAKKFKNINLLEDAIADSVYNGRVSLGEPILVGNLRHIEKLKAAQKLIAGALASLDNKLSLEFITQDVKDALGHLDALLGKAFSEGLLDNIFSKFCVGK